MLRILLWLIDPAKPVVLLLDFDTYLPNTPVDRWPTEYLPAIYDKNKVNTIIDVTQKDAEETMRVLAEKEGIFCGVSSGGAVAGALKLSQQLENAVIVSIICDRGDRYLSTGVFGK